MAATIIVNRATCANRSKGGESFWRQNDIFGAMPIAGIFGRRLHIRTLSGSAQATCAHTNAGSEPMTYAGDNPAEP
jgi:hypothetical protein